MAAKRDKGVNVGRDHDAVASIRRWWKAIAEELFNAGRQQWISLPLEAEEVRRQPLRRACFETIVDLGLRVKAKLDTNLPDRSQIPAAEMNALVWGVELR